MQFLCPRACPGCLAYARLAQAAMQQKSGKHQGSKLTGSRCVCGCRPLSCSDSRHVTINAMHNAICLLSQGNVFVNQYLIIKDLGRGAHGTVKLVFDTEEQVAYAMKVCRAVTQGGLQYQLHLIVIHASFDCSLHHSLQRIGSHAACQAITACRAY